MKAVGKIGELVEQVYEGDPQDIEGAYSTDGKYYVVQTRPQVWYLWPVAKKQKKIRVNFN